MMWEECIRKETARKAVVDKELAKSLLKMSQRRISFISTVKLSDLNAPIILSESYEALREVCEAVLAVKGYKVYSHECITAFLKEVLQDDLIAAGFDRYRKIRNSINYYGNIVTKEETLKGLKDINELVEKLEKHIVI